MNSLIRAEMRKLRTTRTAYGLFLGMAFLAGPGVILSGQTSVTELSRPLQEQTWFFVAAGFTRLLVVVLGIRTLTDEYRHGTIVPSLLVVPDRRRLLAAKVVAAGMTGFVFTIAAEALGVGIAFALITSRGAELTITSETARALAGMALAGLLWAAIGVAVGAIIRRQIPAIVGSLVWLMPGGLEDVVRERLGATVGPYLPGNGGMALALAPFESALWWGVLVLSSYAVVLLVIGDLVTRSRDVFT